jgi:biotin synthase
MYWANRVRRQNFSNAVRLCSIVPGKLGACSEDCKWCAQSVHAGSDKAPPRRTTTQEIHLAASSAITNRAASMGIVNSGRAPSQRDLDDVIEAVREIRSDNNCEIEICASLGELTELQAAQLADAGVTRYHHNLETSRRFFRQVVTTHGYELRIRTLQFARAAGMRICCGGLMGLGETWEDRVDLALTIRDEVNPDVTPLNFLQPMAGTALEDATPLQSIEALAIMAIFRLILPKVDLKVAGGREYNLRDLQSWMFYAGATSCMVGNYLTTTGRDVNSDLQMIEDLGLNIVNEFPAVVCRETEASQNPSRAQAGG